MTRLREAFSEGDQAVRLMLPSCAPLTDAMLAEWLQSAELNAWRALCADASVAVCLEENADVALALMALDGVAARVILLPPTTGHDDLQRLVTRAAPTHLLGSIGDAPTRDLIDMPTPPIPAVASGAYGAPINCNVNTEWVLATSGTTKTPKLVVHSLDTLARSVRRNAAVGRDLCWGLLYDLNRFAGLQVFLQAMLGGSALFVPPRTISTAETIRMFSSAGCNALSATPTMWRKILMTPGSNDLPLRQITLGGEIADGSILKALAVAFPLARIVHIYASTEAGVGFTVTDGREGFPRRYLEEGVPGADLRVDANGILEIRPRVSGQRYLQEQVVLTNADGFVNTGDRVQISEDRVTFLGRDSGAINVGGNKVQPEEVERVLLAHPLVAFASVGPKRSGIMGALVEARIVLRAIDGDATHATSEIREWCGKHLERYKVPAIIRVVDAVDVADSGKVLRREV